MYYPDELIEEVRTRNDIEMSYPIMSVCRKREAPISDCVRFIMKNRLRFLSADRSRCITASDAGQGEMYLRF